MDEETSDGWSSYPLNTTVWVRPPRFWWWPGENLSSILLHNLKVIEQESNAKGTTLIVKTYGDDEGENLCEIKSIKKIKNYNCSDHKEFIEKGRNKYKNQPSYAQKFDEAVKIADDKEGIVQDEEETVQQRDVSCEPRKLFQSPSQHDNTPTHTHEHNSVSTPSKSLSPDDSHNGDTLPQTPTRLQRSAKRLRTDSTSNYKRPTKRKKAAKKDNVSTSNGIIESTPCNSDIESEDDLPAISMTQTPIKSYPSLESIEAGEIVWVKHEREPHWPALVVKGGTKNRTVVKFFNHDDYDYPVRTKKKILPFLCADKEKFEEQQFKDDALKAALKEAYLLLRSRGSEEFSGTPVAQYEAVKKRRSQTTPCKRITYTSCSSDDDEPAESAFGYDIPSKRDCGPANDAATHEVEDLVISTFPAGSLYSYDILKYHFTLLESDLYEIFKGNMPSENHRIFFDGTFKERDSLKIQNRCGPLEYLHMEHWKELQDQMISWVMKWSKAESKEVVEMRYVADVLFPEATIRTMMKIENISIGEAWKKFLKLDPNV